jgi:hypothetical protein
MAISNHQENKFAFLFSGSADPQYVEDLRKVTTTLISFYGYPAANVYVVAGAPVNEFDAVNYPDPLSIFQTAGLNTHILPGPAASDFTDDLTLQIENFLVPLDHEFVSGYQNSVFFYFTGVGEKVAGPPAAYYLDIAIIGVTPVKVNPAWLKGLLVGFAPSFVYNHFNLVMQQSYSYGFYEGTNGINSMVDASLQLTFTSACNSSETIVPETTGSEFTHYWTRGLQYITRNTGFADIFADQESVGSEVTNNFLVSVRKAFNYAKEEVTSLTPMFEYKGDSVDYLGLPSFLIQDGQPSFWESPDIYLTHPNSADPLKKNDLYVVDNSYTLPPSGFYNNTINVVVRNNGTHPVRSYRIGIKVYYSPYGGTDHVIHENGRVPGVTVLKPSRLTAYNSLSPDNNDIYTWNTPFITGTTHECVWAKVTMTVPDDTADPFNYSWNVQVNDNEAQRNTDQGSDPVKTAGKRVTGDTFRGNKQHVYQIKNHFKETCEFILVTLPEFRRSLEYAVMKWSVEGEKKKLRKLVPSNIDRGYDGVHFTLKGGETKNIIGEFGLKPGAKKGLKLRMPVEVVVNKTEGSKTRQPQAPSLKDKYAALAGFTILLTNEPADLICVVLDNKGKPLPGSTVNIQTINGFAVENIKANDKGEVILRKINPDVYRITAELKGAKSKEKIVELTGGQQLTIKLEIIPLKKKSR